MVEEEWNGGEEQGKKVNINTQPSPNQQKNDERNDLHKKGEKRLKQQTAGKQ